MRKEYSAGKSVEEKLLLGAGVVAAGLLVLRAAQLLTATALLVGRKTAKGNDGARGD